MIKHFKFLLADNKTLSEFDDRCHRCHSFINNDIVAIECDKKEQMQLIWCASCFIDKLEFKSLSVDFPD